MIAIPIRKSVTAALALLCASLGGLALDPEAGRAAEAETHDVAGYPAAVPVSSDDKVAAWQKLQMGMFVHWGIYSAYGGYYQGQKQTIGYPEQIKAWMNIPDEEYRAEAASFTAEKFDPQALCRTAKDAGAKYLVLTSKHHDGFAMWDTATTDYDVVEQTALSKDVVGSIGDACRAQGLGFGLYFSIIDWTKQEPEPYSNLNPIPESMMPYIESQLEELLTGYGDLDEIWFDMGAPTRRQSAAMAQTVRDLQPQAMINSRVWNDQGDFEIGGDNVVPTQKLGAPWQSAESIFAKCWGYCSWDEPAVDRSPANIPRKARSLIRNMFTVGSGGGNYLLNIGPKGDGSVDPFDRSVMEEVGKWKARHPHAYDGARPTHFERQDWGAVMTKGNALYLGVEKWREGEIRLPGVGGRVTDVRIDGTRTSLDHTMEGTTLVIDLPKDLVDPMLPVIRVSTAGKPTIIPDSTVIAGAGPRIEIPGERLSATISPAEHRQPLRQTGWFAGSGGNRASAARVTIDGDFSSDVDYLLTVGSKCRVVSGAELNAGPIGGFTYPRDTVTPVSVELADPEYFADPLGATVRSIVIEGSGKTRPPGRPKGNSTAKGNARG